MDGQLTGEEAMMGGQGQAIGGRTVDSPRGWWGESGMSPRPLLLDAAAQTEFSCPATAGQPALLERAGNDWPGQGCGQGTRGEQPAKAGKLFGFKKVRADVGQWP